MYNNYDGGIKSCLDWSGIGARILITWFPPFPSDTVSASLLHSRAPAARANRVAPPSSESLLLLPPAAGAAEDLVEKSKSPLETVRRGRGGSARARRGAEVPNGAVFGGFSVNGSVPKTKYQIATTASVYGKYIWHIIYMVFGVPNTSVSLYKRVAPRTETGRTFPVSSVRKALSRWVQKGHSGHRSPR